jgi:hypothetical protein
MTESKFRIPIFLEIDQVEGIVLQELKNCLELEVRNSTDEAGHPLEVDLELVQALITVIKYYLPYEQIKEFDKEAAALLENIPHQQ